MNLKNKNIGFCLTGSFYNLKNTILQIEELVKLQANIIPIMSYVTYGTDTKYGKSKEYVKRIEEITQKKVAHTIKEIEYLDIKKLTDIMIIAPCSGNTLAKICNAIVDTPVLLAVKAHLRNSKPLVIALSTDDGLLRKC